MVDNRVIDGLDLIDVRRYSWSIVMRFKFS